MPPAPGRANLRMIFPSRHARVAHSLHSGVRMLRRFSIATRLFGIVGLVIFFIGAALFLAAAISTRLEEVVVKHTQEVMLDGEKGKVKACAHSMALALGETLAFAHDDVSRKQLAQAVVNPVRYEADLSGYFFVYQGTVNVALPPKSELQGQDLAGLEDRDGIRYVEELHKQAAAGGGFVSYRFPKPSGPEERKLSYAEMIPGTDMWVGTGVYVDNVDREEARVAAMIGGLFNQALSATGLVFLVMVGVLSALCLAIARSVAVPLAEATQAAERIASGDLDARLDISGRDEAARLQSSLNRMAGILRQNISEIQARREEAEEKAHQAEMALEEARKANDEVVAQVAMRIESLQKISSAVAHQLRNPTMIIGGLAGLLMKKPSLKERYLEYLDGIVEAARRIEGITTAVKQYSSIRLTTREKVPCDAILAAGYEAGNDLARKLGKDVDWTLDAGELGVLADSGLLRMAVSELALNAVEALPQSGGTVRLSACSVGSGVEITVADNGKGIPAEEQQYIFDPFYTTKSVGVGMGLTKAGRVMQEHGGTISLDSAEGRGTTVRLIIPG